MSAVIKRTRIKYQLALGIEIVCFLVIFGLLAAWQWNNALSFILGASAIFIPHCFFVTLIFFTRQEYNRNLTKLYRGEIMKFILTVVCLIACFNLYSSIAYATFFVGYFICILLNNILPFVVDKYSGI
ncbi:MAG: ATP synthase subunit I [[Pasteurella] mairii]|uniref:ATP synthase subunit I n=1 Tax=[Pasteurella] mairii TaxID=757 RepID=A0A379B7P5_9PAST|nr:ATP synthase subunit I [[Pasteurella] mairii]SUB34521.1 ATP synthase subunit I [[Pasteurella] mairii]